MADATTSSASSPKANSNPNDPYANIDPKYVRGSFRFEVKINGLNIFQTFVKISGAKSYSEELEYMHGGDAYVQKAPGRPKFDNVRFERIFTGLDDLYYWRRSIEQGSFDESTRKDVTVYLKDLAGNDIRMMILRNAWPIAWEMPEFDSGASSPAMENFELAATEVYEEMPTSTTT